MERETNVLPNVLIQLLPPPILKKRNLKKRTVDMGIDCPLRGK